MTRVKKISSAMLLFFLSGMLNSICFDKANHTCAQDCNCETVVQHPAFETTCDCQSCGCTACQPENPCAVCQENGCRLRQRATARKEVRLFKKTGVPKSCNNACDPNCTQPCCQSRGTVRPQRCPKCECENCRLEVKNGEVEKVCFQVEQKEVCIPKVRLPWQECCPPTSARSRVVTLLKTHKYKCPVCEYSWSVPEPQVNEPVVIKPAVQQPIIQQPASPCVESTVSVTPDDQVYYPEQPVEAVPMLPFE